MEILKYLFYKLFRLERNIYRYKYRYLFIEEASIGLVEDEEIDKLEKNKDGKI